MKKVELVINRENFYNKVSILPEFDTFDISFSVTLYDKNLLDVLKDKDLFLKWKKINLNEIKYITDDIKGYEDVWAYLLNNFDNLIDNIEYIRINDYDPIKYLEKYPVLKTKKIILNDILDINDFDLINNLIKKYENYNAYIYLIGNHDPVSLKDCKKTMDYIKEKANMIKSLNLSVFETIIFTYDLVRDRIYKYENESDRPTESRDLSKVLFGDSIVCAGYSKMFSAILNYIGIKTDCISLQLKNNENAGHERNGIRIIDPKYNIDGYYYFDTTWDSKKDDNKFLYRYLCLAKTRDEMETLEQNRYIYSLTPAYGKNMIDEFINYVNNRDYEKVINYVKTFNHMFSDSGSDSHVDIRDIFKRTIDLEYTKKCILETLKKYNKKINAETYLKAINNVRKIENYIDSEKYPYDIKTLYLIYLNSKWEFEKEHYDPEELLKSVFGLEVNHDREYDFKNYMYTLTQGYKDMEEDLPKTLKKVLNKKRGNLNV